jgi:SAM-dependent methyltransferase
MTSTDRAWEYFGRESPYFGVLTNARFAPENLDGRARDAFFASGEDYVEMVLRTVHDHLDAQFEPTRALDFGCGVGRLTLPLARRCRDVVGVDVSESMLAEARTNAVAASLTNVTFVKGDDLLSRVDGTFDLVHAFIVFQHIPRSRGEVILGQLIDRLADGGVGILQMTYANSSSTPRWRRMLTTAYASAPALYGLRNVAKREKFSLPPMQMNLYDLNIAVRMLQEAGCHDVHLRFTEASHYSYPIYGVILHFRKKQMDVSSHS